MADGCLAAVARLRTRLVVFLSKQRQGRQALPLDPYCRARSAGGRVKLTCMQFACMHARHKYTDMYVVRLIVRECMFVTLQVFALSAQSLSQSNSLP